MPPEFAFDLPIAQDDHGWAAMWAGMRRLTAGKILQERMHLGMTKRLASPYSAMAGQGC